ncbi:MAG: patatin-like phospholipase family protein [Candidatus Paracaedibacteraceae bacterium]|nr:patatin-like phospholipase family protein [Candidatus Paracaedibacteraceae bacterium]
MEWLKTLVYGAQVATAPLTISEPSLEMAPFPTKVMTMDGGGMRGLYTIKIMQAVEDQLNGKISDHVQVIAGTSTGSILSFGLAENKSLAALEDLYKNHGHEIFYHTTWEMIETGDGFYASKYDPSHFEALLQQNFSQKTLQDIENHHVIVYATNITTQTVKIFDTKTAQKDPEENDKIWFAIRSSTAAPYYFPLTQWKGHALGDGGLIVNNPSMATAIQLKKHYGWDVLKNLKMVSFGTGTHATGMSYEYAHNNGALQWVIPISDMIMKSSSNMYNQWAEDLLSSDQLLRVDGKLTTDIGLDDYSPQSILVIETAALTYIKDNPEMIDRAAKMLGE